jgi:hypothetical protein
MQIPSNIIEDLLIESPTFRHHAAKILGSLSVNPILDQVRQIVNDSDNKIAAIKAVREFSRDNRIDFQNTYPQYEFNEDLGCVGLSVAKNLVESIRYF